MSKIKTVCKVRLGTERRSFGIVISVIFLLMCICSIAPIFNNYGTMFAVGVVGMLILLAITVFLPKVWDNPLVMLGSIIIVGIGVGLIIIRYLLTLNALGFIFMGIGAFVGGWLLKKYGPRLWKEIWVVAGCPEESIKLPEESK